MNKRIKFHIKLNRIKFYLLMILIEVSLIKFQWNEMKLILGNILMNQ